MLTKMTTDTQLRSLPLSNETVDVSHSEKALNCCPHEQAQPILNNDNQQQNPYNVELQSAGIQRHIQI